MVRGQPQYRLSAHSSLTACLPLILCAGSSLKEHCSDLVRRLLADLRTAFYTRFYLHVDEVNSHPRTAYFQHPSRESSMCFFRMASRA